MSQDDLHNLPSILAEIAEVLDLTAALLIAKNYGGKRLYFPSKPKETHDLSNLIGFENAKVICKYFATGENSQRGAEFEIPVSLFGSRAQIHRQIDNLTQSGMSGANIANQLGVSHRTVTRQRTRAKAQLKPSNQFNLFDE